MPATYHLYGLRIRSEVPLAAPQSPRGDPDLEVRWGEPAPVGDEPPGGTVLAEWSLDSRRCYTHTRDEHGYVLRFHRLCEFRVSADRRLVRVHLDPGADPGWASVFLTGNVAAFLLTLAGECVLHASAVEVDGRGLAFLGPPGSGKSTLAALCNANGAGLITDDLLRLRERPEGWLCASGSTDLRLRQHAAGLAAQLRGAWVGRTADGRFAVRCRSSAASSSRLGAVVIPRPSRAHAEMQVRRLGRAEALFRILGYPRVAPVPGQVLLQAQFSAAERVVRSVPVYQARLPWGSPPAGTLVYNLMEIVEGEPKAAGMSS